MYKITLLNKLSKYFIKSLLSNYFKKINYQNLNINENILRLMIESLYSLRGREGSFS